jgi:hypothetical protein
VASVLIELPGGEGIVRRDDGEIVLAYDVTGDWGQPLQPHDSYQPIRIGLSDNRTLVGGLLPPGAVSVEVVEATGVRKAAAVGGGTYAVIFEGGEHSEPALGYRDAAGAFVPRPMPGGSRVSRSPMRRSLALCAGWSSTTSTSRPRSGVPANAQKAPTRSWPAHSLSAGSAGIKSKPERCSAWGRLTTWTRMRKGWLASARSRRRSWYSDKITLMAVTFPVYAAEGWPAWIKGSGSHGDDLTRLVIAHADTLPDSMFVERPRIEITTSIDPYQPGELAVARDPFASGVEADANRRPADGLSDAALTLWFRAVRRRRVAGSQETPVSKTEITIDGVHDDQCSQPHAIRAHAGYASPR